MGLLLPDNAMDALRKQVREDLASMRRVILADALKKQNEGSENKMANGRKDGSGKGRGRSGGGRRNKNQRPCKRGGPGRGRGGGRGGGRGRK